MKLLRVLFILAVLGSLATAQTQQQHTAVGGQISTPGYIKFGAKPGTGSGFTFAGDLTGTASSQQVVGILTHALPTLTTGYLHWNGTAWVFDTPAGGGGGSGTPGGASGQLQFNNAGAFGGTTGFTWNSGTGELDLTSGTGMIHFWSHNTSSPEIRLDSLGSSQYEVLGFTGNNTPNDFALYHDRIANKLAIAETDIGSNDALAIINGITSLRQLNLGSTIGGNGLIKWFGATSGNCTQTVAPDASSITFGCPISAPGLGGGGGSGTVNSGLANQIAFYSVSGTAVSGDSKLTDNGTQLQYSGNGYFTGNLQIDGTLSVRGPWLVNSFLPASPMGAAPTSQSSIGISNDGNFYISANSGTPSEICTVANGVCGSGGGGSMTWPGAAGIANYAGSNAWGTSYSATNLIPASFISILNQSTTGNAATATNLSSSGTANQVWGMNSGGTAQGWQPNPMTWPTGGAGIPAYNGSSGWGTSYSATNTIPANFIPTLNQSTTGNAATATAFAAGPTTCAVGNYPRGVDAQGNALNCTPLITMTYPTGSAGLASYNGSGAWGVSYNAGNPIPANFIPTLNQNTTGNASTATALATTPTKCSAGSYPNGVDASGNAQGCTALNSYTAPTGTGFSHVTGGVLDAAATTLGTGVTITAGALTTVGQQPYEIGITINGVFTSSQVFIRKPTSLAYTIPSGCTNSQITLGTATTASLTITLLKNGTSFGTAVIAAGTTGGSSNTTWTCATATSFTVGTDVLTISAPSSADTTAANFGGSIYATR